MPASSGPISLTLFGGWGASGGSPASVALASRKAQALFAYLALYPGEPHTRQKLMTLLWGECEERLAGQSLRRALYLLRRAFDPAGRVLVATADTLLVRPTAVTVDVLEFERFVKDGSPAALERAAALYRGELLEGLAVESDGFDEWLRRERERLYELAVESLGKLLKHQGRAGQDDGAIQTAVRLLGLDPTEEVVHRTLMRLYAGQGRRAAALRQYQVCVNVLRRELDTEPEAETTELYLGLLQRHGHSAEPEKPGPTSRAPRRGRGQALGEVPLVGRDKELGALLDAFDSACAGRGRLVLISGETGIGKSRLLAELPTLTRHRGARLMMGRCHQTEQVLPFRPLIEAIREANVLGAAELRASLSAVARTELPRLFPELGELSGAVSTRPESRTSLFEALAELVTYGAERTPLVLALEDVHWADEMTLRFVAFLARRLTNRVLLVATFRDEEVADTPALGLVLSELQREPTVLTVALEPLSEPETRELVEALGQPGSDDTLARARAERVWHASSGNPLVIVETMREILERHAENQDEVASLPKRVRELIQTRLARLEEPVRHLIAVSAATGEPAAFELLVRASGMSDRETAEGVEQLVRRRILHSVGERFAFSHERIRQVAYETLTPARRRTLHRSVGEAMEALHTGGASELDDRLAHHFSQAGVADKAVTYLRRFAETARQRYAIEEGLRSLDQALALVDMLAEAVRARTRLELLLQQAFALSIMSRYREVDELLTPHLALVESLDAPAIAGQYYFRLGIAHLHLGASGQARMRARRAVDEGRRSGDGRILGQSHYLLALEAHWSGRDFAEGAALARQSIQFLEQSGEGHYRGWAYYTLAYHLLHLGEFAAALDAAAQPAVLADRCREPRLKNLGWLIGLIHATRGDGEAAVPHCVQVIERGNDDLMHGAALACLGYAHAEQGHLDRAIAELEEGLGRLRAISGRPAEARFLSCLVDAHLQRGDPDRARETAGVLAAVSQQIDYALGRALAQRSLGRTALAVRDVAAAEHHLQAAHESFAALGCEFEAVRTSLHLAEVLHVMGRVEESHAAALAAGSQFAALRAPRWERRAIDLASAAMA